MTTASMAGITTGQGGLVSYFATKHACVSVTESLYFELIQTEAGRKIAVHVLCPALVSSQLSTSSADVKAAIDGDKDHAEVANGELWGDAMSRREGSVEQLARMAKHLPMSKEFRELVGDNEEALAKYATQPQRQQATEPSD